LYSIPRLHLLSQVNEIGTRPIIDRLEKLEYERIAKELKEKYVIFQEKITKELSLDCKNMIVTFGMIS